MMTAARAPGAFGGTAATKAWNMQSPKTPAAYVAFRPNVSEIGGRKTLPTPSPIKYLSHVSAEDEGKA